MFEGYKLNKYRKYFVGMAYDISGNSASYDVYTYLVIKKDYNYSYIFFHKTKFLSAYETDKYIESLEQLGYKPLSYYIENKVFKERTLAKSKFKRLK